MKRWKGTKNLFKRLFYMILFLIAFLTVCYLLDSPHLARLFYPFHYREQIHSSAAAHNLDPLLVAAVIYIESGFRPHAESSRGARGLMQVMPTTAEWVAERSGMAYAPEMLLDPAYNIEIGCWYLADLLKLFDGNIVVALAAYNGGRAEVGRWLEQGIWDGSESRLEQIPFSETRHFVRRVLETYAKYQEIYHNEEANYAYCNTH